MRRNTILVPLLGGIGNQLFQYFAGKIIANEFQRELILDISHPSLRKNRINKAAISDFDFAKSEEFVQARRGHWESRCISLAIRNSVTANLYTSLIRGLCASFFWTNSFGSLSFKRLGISNDLGYNDLERFSRASHVIGYFQSYRYLQTLLLGSHGASWEQLIKKSVESLLPNVPRAEKGRLILHIRRGDYIAGKFGLLSGDYYERAVKFLEENGSTYEVTAISDGSVEDLKILPKKLKERTHYLNTQDFSSAELVTYVSQFENVVLANSSMTWWGARFGEIVGTTKQVIAPSPWFQNMNPPKEIHAPNWRLASGIIWE